MRNGFISVGEFQTADKNINFWRWNPPLLHCFREDGTVVLIVPARQTFFCPATNHNSLIKSFFSYPTKWHPGHSLLTSLSSLHSRLHRWPRKTWAMKASPSYLMVPAQPTLTPIHSIFCSSDNFMHQLTTWEVQGDAQLNKIISCGY